MLNLLSLITGIIAWVFGCWAIASKENRKSHGLSMGSLSMCSIALASQLLEISRRVALGDFAAIEDTIKAIIIASLVLVLVTLLLNVVALIKNK